MGRYEADGLATILPLPGVNANKYSRGKLILFAGSAAFPGAACLAACASQQAGAGYTEVITAPRAVQVVQVARPSLVVRSWSGIYDEELQSNTLEKPCAYVLGPGLDLEKKHTSALTYFVLGNAEAPVLVDGGSLAVLNSAAGMTMCVNRSRDGFPTVLTPHAGEAQRLAAGYDMPLHDPAQLAVTLALYYKSIVVLKGPVTFVSDGFDVFSLAQGTPALAKAGTGDVLAGIIGAFMAQGVAPIDAAVLGVTLHSKAGCIAAEELTVVSVTAEDVIANIPTAIGAVINPPMAHVAPPIPAAVAPFPPAGI